MAINSLGVVLREIELAKGIVIAAEYVLEVLKNRHRGGAKGTPLEVEDRHGVVEVALAHCEVHAALDLFEVDFRRDTHGLFFEPRNAEAKPRTRRGGDPVHHAGGEGADCEG